MSYLLTSAVLTGDPLPSSQGTNHGRTFANGSPHQTHPQIIISRVVLIIREQQHGSFKAVSSRNGGQQVRSFGSTENVCTCPAPLWILLDGLSFAAGSGKTIIWFVDLKFFLSGVLMSSVSTVPQSSKILRLCVRQGKPRSVIFISIFGTPTNNIYTTWSLPF